MPSRALAEEVEETTLTDGMHAHTDTHRGRKGEGVREWRDKSIILIFLSRGGTWIESTNKGGRTLMRETILGRRE